MAVKNASDKVPTTSVPGESIHLANDFSLGIWMKPKSLKQPIASMGNLDEWWWWTNSDGNMVFTVGDGPNVTEVRTTSSITVGEWKHLAVTVESPYDETCFNFYINGVKQPKELVAKVGDFTKPNDSKGPLKLGAFPTQMTSGSSYESLTMWDRKFSKSEVKKLYKDGPMEHPACNDLVAHWPLGEGDTADIFFEETGTMNHFVANGVTLDLEDTP